MKIRQTGKLTQLTLTPYELGRLSLIFTEFNTAFEESKRYAPEKSFITRFYNLLHEASHASKVRISTTECPNCKGWADYDGSACLRCSGRGRLKP